jgi:spermidine synthase
VYATESKISGRLRVVDYRNERRLIVRGAILSAVPLDGNWRALRREYWWRALTLVTLRHRPTALFVGLGGGTQVHLLRQLAQPRLVTVIERDPRIVRIAIDWFGLGDVDPMEVLCGDAATLAAALERAGRRFDFVMEDAAYADDREPAVALARALAPLVAPGGALVVNRHHRGDALAVARALRPRFTRVGLLHVRREAENVLVCCTAPRLALREDIAPRPP